MRIAADGSDTDARGPAAVLTAERLGSTQPQPTMGRRRSVATTEQKIAVAVITAVGAVGALLSDASPTGHSVIDAVYRVAFVVLLALAASRARRWSVVIGSALAAIGSLGFALIASVLALLLAVFLVGRDVRSRVYGAAIGALMGFALLRLEVGGFLGAPILVAAVASGCVFFSAYRTGSRRAKAQIRLGLVVAVLVVVVGSGLAIYQAIAFRSDLQAAVDDTLGGINTLESGKTIDASARFADASEQFRSVADTAGQWWLLPSHLVPVVSQNVQVITSMSDAGASLTDAAYSTSKDVDYDRLRRPGGGVDLGILAGFREPVAETATRLAMASRVVDDLDSPWIVGLLAEKVDEFRVKVVDLRDQAELAALGVEAAPEILGGKGTRRYLVLLGNPAESRDLGGHIGNMAELSVTDGSITLEEVREPLELAQPALDKELAKQDQEFPDSLLELSPARHPQNWGGSSDFPTDARLAALLYQRKTGVKLDGVMYADPFTLAGMMSVTGPVKAPGLDRELTSANIVEFLTREQYTLYEPGDEGNGAVTELVREIFRRFTKSTLPGPKGLSDVFGPLTREGRFRMVSFRAEDARLLARLGLANGLRPTDGEDLIAVLNRNANPSKIDTFLQRDSTYEVDWDPDSGALMSSIEVVLRNDAPSSGLPVDVIGNGVGLPLGTNRTDVVVLTPLEAVRATVDGDDAPIAPLRDQGMWRHTIRVEIPSGSTVRVRLELEGEVDPGSTYRLTVGGQPLVQKGELKVRVSVKGQEIVPGEGISVGRDGATVTLSDVGKKVLTLRVQ